MFTYHGNSWDLALLAIAAYVAVLTLVRLMLAERDRLRNELQAQIDAEQARVAAAKRKAEKELRQKKIKEEYEKQKKKAA